MEIALLSASMLDRSWEETLDAASKHGIRLIEACAGGHIPKVHYDPVQLAANDSALAAFRRTLELLVFLSREPAAPQSFDRASGSR